MLNIERALKQDRLLRAMTGLNRKAFDALLPTFSTIYDRKAQLRNPQDKLFYILFYFKRYPTFDLAEF